MDINEVGGRPGREVALAWPEVRDEVLVDWDWNFCRGRESIPKLAGQAPFGYEFQYSAPTDALKVWSVDENFTRFGDDTDIFASSAGRLSANNIGIGGSDQYGSGTSFVVEDGKISTNKDIITDLTVVNVPGLPVTFTRRVTQASKYPAFIVPVFYYRLAMQVAMAITGDRQIFSDMAALYNTALKTARSRNATEGLLKRPISTFVAVRE